MSAPGISVVYATARDEPGFRWFADGLARQLPDSADVEMIVVDGRFDAGRSARFGADAAGRFALRHVAAKPSPYQGPYRRTSRDCFAAASARNTGLVHARAPYVVFADDCSVPMPGWWRAVERAAARGEVVAGAYQKRSAMRVDDGLLAASLVDDSGIDTRWPLGDDARPVPVHGGQLYGASFGAPRELLLSINGLDEQCDSIGYEDVQLGLRLAHAGATILYDRSMLTIESLELGSAGLPLLRVDPELPEREYRERLADFGVTRRPTQGRFDASHMILDVVLGTGSWATHGNCYWLADLVPDGYGDMVRRFPDTHWFDGCLLSTM